MESVREDPTQAPTLGRYRLIAEIARGGMGVVYLASAQGAAGFRKLVVIKELIQEMGRDEEFVRMFMEEARLSARLNHRNIVQTHEVDSENGRHFMTLDYLEGRSFHHLLRRFGRKKDVLEDCLIRVVVETLAGLHYAHELTDYNGDPLGIVHRDVAPNNIFVTFDGQVKLLDFGVAKTQDRIQKTQAGMLKGRVRYMAPEQLTGGADRRTDIFSAGAILRELLTGTRLWGDMPDLQILSALTHNSIPAFPVNDQIPVPAELQRICEKAMAPAAKDRYPTAEAMRLELDAYLAGRGQLSELGSTITQIFAKEEKELRQRIDTHLANGVGHPEILRLDSNSNWQNSPNSGLIPNSGISITSSTSSNGPSISLTNSLLTTGGTLPTTTAVAPMSRARLPILIALSAVGLVALTALIATVLLRPPVAATAATAVAPQPSAVTTAPVATASAAASSRVLVLVSPSTAQIFVDSAAVGQNPFQAFYPRGEEKHTIRAVAAGYTPKTEEVAFSSAEVNVTISLDPVGATAPPVARAGLPAATAVSTTPVAAPNVAAPKSGATAGDVDPRGGKAPKHTIDSHDPYGVK